MSSMFKEYYSRITNWIFSELYSISHLNVNILKLYLQILVSGAAGKGIQRKLFFLAINENNMHCLKNGPHFTFYTAEATNAILYGA